MNQDKKKRIDKSYKNYKSMFKDISEDLLKINDDLFKNVAFMTVALEDLQETIGDNGAVENFEQGKQKFMRESPAMKAYNSTIKNFNASMKILNDLRPNKDDSTKAGEKLLGFLASDKK